MIKSILAITILIVTLYGGTKEALEAFKNRDYTTAFKLYTKSAKAGDSTAQNALSYLYFNGFGVHKNKEKGIEWLKKSAHNMNAVAQYDLGMMYLSGTNIEQNSKLAFSWLDSSSDLGNPNAQFYLAIMHYKGDATDINATRSVDLLKLSALQGNEKAKRNIGRIYMQLLRFDEALAWLLDDAKAGDTGAYYLLGEIYCEKEEWIEAKKWVAKAKLAGNKNAPALWKKYNLDKY